MTHLYRIFDIQAKEFCKDSMIDDCYRNILLDGLQHLIHIDEYILDTLDPYQRNARLHIWRSLVGSKLIKNRIDDSVKNSYSNDIDSLDMSDSDDNELAEGSSSVIDYLNPSSHGESYPSGPYIIRVYPDGRPVPINNKQLKPYDDDLDELTYYHNPPMTELLNNGREQRVNKLQQAEGLSHKYTKGTFNNGIKHDSIKNSIKFTKMIRTIESK
ncbi:hypothetical protein PV327_009995 [Microctonus hyperodae]|uniref:Uncharacterized protein n=1 Tax=Microctonus hyperodae TaxID=165561 RepID=A0AA39F254_MICHY|nr:hypothetical protein PV327_009995 [Microctonus hyperodae]